MDGVRFGCGALVGAIFATSLVIGWLDLPLAVIAIVAAAVIVGLVAARYGDPFWEWLARWWPWF